MSSTKGIQLSYQAYPLSLKHVFTVAGSSRISTPGVQVQLQYDNYIGYGEASMPPYLGETTESVIAFLNKVKLKRFHDPFFIEEILSYIDQLAPGNTAAKAAIDIALHDLVGKIIGRPWFQIWGLDPQTGPATTYTIGMDTPEVVKQKTLEMADQFNILKVKMGQKGDKQVIQAIREVSPLPLSVDANQGWTDRNQALETIHWLKEQGVVMIEQPLPKEQLDDIAWLTQHSPLPIFADESIQRLKDIEQLKGAFTGINIKLMKCTGMREAWKIATTAKALDMKVMIGCMTETSCAISAAAQIAPLADFADLDGHLLISNDPFVGAQLMEGKIIPQQLPGIGITLKNTDHL